MRLAAQRRTTQIQPMGATQSKANPTLVNELFKKKLASSS
jgi:hypothetical protein